MLREKPEHYQQAHVLMPMVEKAVSHLKWLLVDQMDMWAICERISRSQRVIDHPSTLKLLVKVKLVGQMREDLVILMCLYLDLQAHVLNYSQLRDEHATDQLINILGN